MSIQRLLPVAFACFAAGCSGLASSPSVVTSGQSAGVAGRSWISPGVKTKDLLYVTDSRNNEVTIYGYRNGQGKSLLVGQITGLSNPQGECTDAKGDVWVANDGASQLLEYAHGGTKPIATLSDSGYYPVACSIDPKTGDLAVSNDETTNGSPGNVAIFKHAKGTPSYYSDSAIYRYAFCGYDERGNLFVDGLSYGSNFEFAELANGGASLTGVSLDQPIVSPGAIVWDGSHLAVGDDSSAVIYQFTIKDGEGKKVGSTQLDGTEEVLQFSIDDRVLIAPDFIYSRVWFFKYPEGGNDFGEVLYYISSPVAALVSKGS
jgi:hypothetical protein